MRPQKKILVIDDEPGVRLLFTAVLKRHGFAATTAANGIEGVEASTREAFDLIFIDVNMPLMKGTEAFRRIKLRRPDQRVIMMSGNLLSEQIELDVPSSEGWLRKPFGYHELVAILREKLGPGAVAALATR